MLICINTKGAPVTELNDLEQPASNRVFIKDDRILVINDFEIKDLQVVELIKAKIESGEDSEELLEELIRIGAKAASLYAGNEGADTINRAIADAEEVLAGSLSEVSQTITNSMESITDSEGKLSTNLNAALAAFQVKVSESLSKEDAPVRTAIMGAINENMEKLKLDFNISLQNQKTDVANLLNPQHSTSPLGSFNLKFKEIADELHELSDGVKALQITRNARETQAAKGTDLEDNLSDVLNDVALGKRDIVSKTGTKKGRMGTQKGDIVVALDPVFTRSADLNIVWECKAKNVGIEEIRAEVHEGMANRQAVIGLAAFDINKCPKDVKEDFTEFDDWAIVIIDRLNPDVNIIRYAYLWSRLMAMKSLSRTTEGVDEAAVKEALTRIRGQMKTITQIKSDHGSVGNALRLADLHLRSLDDGLKLDIDRLEKLLIAQEEAESGVLAGTVIGGTFTADEDLEAAVKNYELANASEISSRPMDDRDIEMSQHVQLGTFYPRMLEVDNLEWLEDLGTKAKNALVQNVADGEATPKNLASWTLGELKGIRSLGTATLNEILNAIENL
jgi:hypothetical protein